MIYVTKANKPNHRKKVNATRNRIYTNGEITIYWQGTECIHATICYRELREVFDPSARPWINPKGASTARIKDIIERCPTQALTFRWNDPARNETETSHKLFQGEVCKVFSDCDVKPKATITLRPNGPLIITGDFSLHQLQGSKTTELRKMEMVSLCRCGYSANMPYCDGTHFKQGFKD